MTKFQKIVIGLLVALVAIVASIGIIIAVSLNNARVEAEKAQCEADYGFGSMDYFVCVEFID